MTSATYAYDTTGRLSTITDGTDTFTYGYEADSNLLASLTAPQHTVTYSYEENRNVMTAIDNKVSGSTISKYAYTYDDLGRRADRAQTGSEVNTVSTDDFSYNSRSEVIESENSVETAAKWNPTYSFDKIGNRQSSTGFQPVTAYSTNNVNQYTALDVVSPTHDLDGNLTDNGGLWTYTWNNENRLSSATNGTLTIDFTYDYQGRLVKKDDGTNVEVYVYDGWNRIATFTEDSLSVLTHHSSNLWGLDLSGSMQGAGGVGGLLKEGDLYPTYDANGNIMQKFDGTGVAVMSVDYDPFGNIISGTLVGEYGFSTKPLVDDLDWYYYGFRYYDPGTGRWPSRDPLGEYGGINLYGMVFNDPVNWYDFLGLSADCGCDDDGNQIKEEDDDFGSKCCPDKMETVSIVVKPTQFDSSGISDFGHAAIKIPRGTAGLWPSDSANKENPNRPGKIANDKDVNFTKSYDYDACPDSLSKVETWMSEQIEQINNQKQNPFGGSPDETYQGMNGKTGRNCMGWACEGISQAGGTPPANPTQPYLPAF